MKKTPWLFRVHVGDDILPKYEGIRINYKKDPLLNNDSMESKVVFVLWLFLFPETVPGSRDTFRCGKRVPGTLSLEKKHGRNYKFLDPIITITNYIFIKSSRYLFGTSLQASY